MGWSDVIYTLVQLKVITCEVQHAPHPMQHSTHSIPIMVGLQGPRVPLTATVVFSKLREQPQLATLSDRERQLQKARRCMQYKRIQTTYVLKIYYIMFS